MDRIGKTIRKWICGCLPCGRRVSKKRGDDKISHQKPAYQAGDSAKPAWDIQSTDGVWIPDWSGCDEQPTATNDPWDIVINHGRRGSGHSHVGIHQLLEEIQMKQPEEAVDETTEKIQLPCTKSLRTLESGEHSQSRVCSNQVNIDDNGQVSGGQCVSEDHHQIFVQTNITDPESPVIDTQALLDQKELAEKWARVAAEASCLSKVTLNLLMSSQIIENDVVKSGISELNHSENSSACTHNAAAILSQVDTKDILLNSQQLVVNQVSQPNEIVHVEYGEDSPSIPEPKETIISPTRETEESNEEYNSVAFHINPENQSLIITSESQVVFSDVSSKVPQLSITENEETTDGQEVIVGVGDPPKQLEVEIGSPHKDHKNCGQIVIVVSDEPSAEAQQIPIRFPNDPSHISTAVITVPTPDSDHQVLIIPISFNENGNTVLTLPQQGDGDLENGNATLVSEQSQLQDGSGEQ